MGKHDRPQTTKSVLINVWSIVSLQQGIKGQRKAICLKRNNPPADD